eukprot:m.558794 g.558794  ORF g.558794 m.558794 type:complete len:454 (+) comp22200_c1_seq24:2321-3682(+)
MNELERANRCCTGGVQRIRDELAKLKNEMQELLTTITSTKANEKTARAEEKRLRDEIDVLQSVRKKVGQLRQKHKLLSEKLASTRSDRADARNDLESCQQKSRDLAMAWIDAVTKLEPIKEKMLKVGTEYYENTLKLAQYVQDMENLEDAQKELKVQKDALRSKVAELKSSLKINKDEAKRLLKIARDSIGGMEQLSAELNAAFQQIAASTTSELENLITSEQTKLQCAADTDTDIVQDFESTEKKIAEHEVTANNAKKAHEKLVHDIEHTKSQWLPQLESVISQVSQSFGDMLSHLGFDGEVKLHTHETDYTQFGVEIYVSFEKSGKLVLLEAGRQSGGEKSVSTMLYLMSLQMLSPCPFRVVDEINQGMDHVNERKVFDQIVRCSELSGDQQSQYFLVTPKLLSDLTYPASMRIICIFNGSWVDGDDWKPHDSKSHLTGILRDKRRRLGLS